MKPEDKALVEGLKIMLRKVIMVMPNQSDDKTILDYANKYPEEETVAGLRQAIRVYQRESKPEEKQ